MPTRLSSAHPMACYCFDLCPRTSTARFWASTRGVSIQDAHSPWTAYFGAVYGEEVPLPFPLSNITFFYHNSMLWRQLFPSVHNPFRSCDTPVPSERHVTPLCGKQECRPWMAPLRVPDQSSTPGAWRAENLISGMSMSERKSWGWPGFAGLAGSRLASPQLFQTWRRHGVPTVDGWVEVTRTNIFNRGMYPIMLEEGVAPDVAKTINFISGEREGPGAHGAYPSCYFNAAVGTGIWTYIGQPRNHTRMNLRDNQNWDVITSWEPCRKALVGIGTCPPREVIRAGWRASRPCQCNESWSTLNCHGHGKTSREVPREVQRARWGPWFDPFQVWPLSHAGDRPNSPSASLRAWPGMERQLGLAMETLNTTTAVSAAQRATWLPTPAPCSLYNAAQKGRSPRLCTAAFHGTSVQYLQLAARDEHGICGRLRAINDGSNTMRSFVFAFVSEPVQRFLTQARQTAQSRCHGSTCVTKHVAAAIKDFVTGCGRNATHQPPQVALLTAAFSNRVLRRKYWDGREESHVQD